MTDHVRPIDPSLFDAGGRARIVLTHLGFGNGADWDRTYAYFDAAWDRMLPLMKAGLEAK